MMDGGSIKSLSLMLFALLGVVSAVPAQSWTASPHEATACDAEPEAAGWQYAALLQAHVERMPAIVRRSGHDRLAAALGLFSTQLRQPDMDRDYMTDGNSTASGGVSSSASSNLFTGIIAANDSDSQSGNASTEEYVCVTREDPRASALGYTTPDPGTQCVFGVDDRDEGYHCILDEGTYGSYGWCWTSAAMDAFGSCSESCPLFGQLRILERQIKELSDQLRDVRDVLLSTSTTSATTSTTTSITTTEGTPDLMSSGSTSSSATNAAATTPNTTTAVVPAVVNATAATPNLTSASTPNLTNPSGHNQSLSQSSVAQKTSPANGTDPAAEEPAQRKYSASARKPEQHVGEAKERAPGLLEMTQLLNRDAERLGGAHEGQEQLLSVEVALADMQRSIELMQRRKHEVEMQLVQLGGKGSAHKSLFTEQSGESGRSGEERPRPV